MGSKEKTNHILSLFLNHTTIMEDREVDVNDLNHYIKHALDKGLINKDEMHKYIGIIET